MKLLLTSDTRFVDQATCQVQSISMADLMERAAGRAAEAIVRRYGHQRFTRRIHVFIGPGNNGGDAIIIARRLIEEGFRQVKVYDPHRPFELNIDPSDLIIDGLFGAGLNRPLEGAYAYLVQAINDSQAEVVSIDIPSGLMGESNASNDLSHVVKADLTLTFTAPKLCMLMPEYGRYVGEIEVIDIDIPRQVIEQTSSTHYIITREDLRRIYRPRNRFSHKGTYGNAWLAVGSRGMMGAALLAARAAMRGGVGLLTVYVPGCGYTLLQGGIPEAKCETDTHADHLTSLTPAASFNAIAIGPGLGQSADTAKALGLLLERDGRAMVLDADALNILAQHPEWMRKIKPGSILTPHPKEADRLLAAAWRCGLLDMMPGARENYGPVPPSGRIPTYVRLLTLRALAEKLRIVIVLKGTYTAICTPDGKIHWQFLYGNPGMAVGGSGDTLTGLLLALVAQGYRSVDAAILGVSMHALAADLAIEAGQSFESLLPSDIIAHLGGAFRTLISAQ